MEEGASRATEVTSGTLIATATVAACMDEDDRGATAKAEGNRSLDNMMGKEVALKEASLNCSSQHYRLNACVCLSLSKIY